MVQNKFKYLVADTTAFINNVQLNEYADNVITISDVINEVKNKRQIRRLVVLPFDLQVQEPDAESLAFVANFAKQTGDYASLSSIDLKIIALTYQLEKTHVGTDHLRIQPIVAKTVASKSKPEEFHVKTPLAGFYNPKNENDKNDSSEENNENELTEENNASDEDSKVKPEEQKKELTQEEEEGDDNDISEEQLKACFEKLSCQPDEDEDVNVLVPEKSDENANQNDSDSGNSDGSYEEDEDDDESSWITPSNVQKVKKEMGGEMEEEIPAMVACMSTDFAIQNVLKQINLNIAALNGRVIKQIRTYILRCYACFKTTSIITKIFCPNCGNKTLKRVAVSLDENGKQVIHINTRRPLTAKFKNKSLPLPRGGKHSRNPVLVEDQPIPKQMPSRVAKTKTNALDEDYIAGYSPFVVRDVDSKSALLRSKGNIKQWARNNMYEEDRRKKSANRFVK